MLRRTPCPPGTTSLSFIRLRLQVVPEPLGRIDSLGGGADPLRRRIGVLGRGAAHTLDEGNGQLAPSHIAPLTSATRAIASSAPTERRIITMPLACSMKRRYCIIWAGAHGP